MSLTNWMRPGTIQNSKVFCAQSQKKHFIIIKHCRQNIFSSFFTNERTPLNYVRRIQRKVLVLWPASRGVANRDYAD